MLKILKLVVKGLILIFLIYANYEVEVISNSLDKGHDLVVAKGMNIVYIPTNLIYV